MFQIAEVSWKLYGRGVGGEREGQWCLFCHG